MIVNRQHQMTCEKIIPRAAQTRFYSFFRELSIEKSLIPKRIK